MTFTALILIFCGAVNAQLYPTLIQSRPLYLPAHLPPNLQLAGAVPVYEPAYPHPQDRMPKAFGTSMAPQQVVVESAPQPVMTSVVPQMVPAVPPPSAVIQALPIQQPYAYAPQYSYGYQYPGYPDYNQKRENPLKRFLKGAADGFMVGAVGWMG
ncbi:unnamed protein product [Cylicocyclus nassatus]|uniref:Uncharacterized protein n=1 Tax=Cylicocyclus nassatus TaxID=53992 RepID=A0AA36GJ97_CYLNA|nr:unnamed protein product [Cylicocyclus nassatus]